jgi:hypothetical protein
MLPFMSSIQTIRTGYMDQAAGGRVVIRDASLRMPRLVVSSPQVSEPH